MLESRRGFLIGVGRLLTAALSVELPLLLNDHATRQPLPTRQSRKDALQPEEREIVEYLERSRGYPLTDQEINLALDQARLVGHL